MLSTNKKVIHEMAHAYLAQKLSAAEGGSIAGYMDYTFQDLFALYTEHIDPATGRYTENANSDAQHEYMAESLALDMAYGLRDNVERNTPAIKNDPEVSTDNYIAEVFYTRRGTKSIRLKNIPENQGGS